MGFPYPWNPSICSGGATLCKHMAMKDYMVPFAEVKAEWENVLQNCILPIMPEIPQTPKAETEPLYQERPSTPEDKGRKLPDPDNGGPNTPPATIVQ